jgi:hypothetical protein
MVYGGIRDFLIFAPSGSKKIADSPEKSDTTDTTELTHSGSLWLCGIWYSLKIGHTTEPTKRFLWYLNHFWCG